MHMPVSVDNYGLGTVTLQLTVLGTRSEDLGRGRPRIRESALLWAW